MRVRHDHVIRPDGKPGIFGVVEKKNYPLIVPRSRGRYYLVCQYRYAVRSDSWEFPQGHQEPGESLAQAGHRELQEETGLTTKRNDVRSIGFFWLAPGHHTQGCHVLLADRCRIGVQDVEASEGDLRVRAFTSNEVERMISSGKIKDGLTIAAFYLALRAK